MAGNVWEWVADWYAKDSYIREPRRNPRGPETGSWKVLRGGSWGYPPYLLRTTSRLSIMPHLRNTVIGFRCADGRSERRTAGRGRRPARSARDRLADTGRRGAAGGGDAVLAQAPLDVNCYGRHLGIDPNERERYRGQPHFDRTAEFCALYDEVSFDPDYTSEPMTTFEPMIRRVDKRWTPPT